MTDSRTIARFDARGRDNESIVMRGKLVAGNWKLNGTLEKNRALLNALLQGRKPAWQAEIAVCAPFPYLAQLQELLRGSPIAWGAQSLSEYAQGAYTGEVSAAMLAEFGCRYVIVGHSERRALFGESDEVVAKKFAAAQGAGLTPILCIGETLSERESGSTETLVARQVDAVVNAAGAAAFAKAVIAYEPVWAIGTGKTASADQAQAVHAFIRARLAQSDANVADGVRILYGGSVKAANAAELFAMPDIDGGLIGGASLDAQEFLAICEAGG